MATVAEVLAAYGADVSESALAEALAERLNAEPNPVAALPAAGLLEDLLAYGGFDDLEGLANWSPVDERRVRLEVQLNALADIVDRTVSGEQAATLLGVDRTRVAHRAGSGEVLAVRVAGKRRYPRWQFVDDRPSPGERTTLVPGLASVIAHLPQLHPLDIDTLMTQRTQALGDRSPVEFLVGGGPPEAVAELLEQWDRG